MWPWDGPAPHSLAHGILDDMTYDWFYLLRAVLRTGGRAEILAEDTIGRALRPRPAAHGYPGLPDRGRGAGRADPADRHRGRSTRANRPACSSRGLTGLWPGDIRNDFSATGPDRAAPRRCTPMNDTRLITGPTFAEMLDPARIRKDLRAKALATKATDPLDPINLYNITWKDGAGRIYHEVLPRELTGVDTPDRGPLRQGLPDRQPQGRRDLLGADREGQSAARWTRRATPSSGPPRATTASAGPGSAAACSSTRS